MRKVHPLKAFAVSPWLPVIISGVVLLIGVGVQLAAFAYFTGRMKGGQEATNALVLGLINRMDAFDKGALNRAEEKGDLSARLDHVEKNTEGLGSIREQLVRLTERFEGAERTATARDETYRSHFDSLGRQMQGLAGMGPGRVLELTPDLRPSTQARRRATPPET